MRIIIIESDVYRVTEKQYKDILDTHDRVLNSYHPENDVIMMDFLNDEKKNYKHLGPVEYDFRL